MDEYELVANDSPLYPLHKDEKVHHDIEEQEESLPQIILVDSTGRDRDNDEDDDDGIRLEETIITASNYKIILIMYSHPRKASAVLLFIITCLIIITVKRMNSNTSSII
jgi:hypothetical protein